MALGHFFSQFSLRALGKRFLKRFGSTAKRRLLREKFNRRFSRFESLEDRALMAVVDLSTPGSLQLQLTAVNDSINITAVGTTSIRVTSGTAFDQTYNNINSIDVQDVGANAGQVVTFTSNGSSRINVGGAITVGGIENVTFDTSQPLTAQSLTITAITGGTTSFSTGVNSSTIITSGAQTYGNQVILRHDVGLTAGGVGVSMVDVNLNNNTLSITGPGVIAGAISGGGGLTKESPGTLTLSGAQANTYRGVTTVNGGELDLNKTATQAIGGNVQVSGGILKLLASNQIIDSSLVTVSSGTFDFNTTTLAEAIGTLNLNGGTVLGGNAVIDFTVDWLQSAGTLSSTTNTFSVAGNVLRTGGTFNHNNGRFVFSGAVFQNARTAGAIFNDVFHPIAGTVKLLDSFNAIGSFTNSAGVFDLNGFNLNVGTFVLTGGTVSSSIAGGQVQTLNPFDLQSGTVSAVLAGSAGLTKSGGGTVILSGANTYSGPTTVADGTLAVNGSITSNVTATAPGVLGGTGIVNGNVSGNGTFSPGVGNTPGILRITGNFAPTGIVQFDVNSPYTQANAGIDYDQFIVNGAVDLSASNLTFVNTNDSTAPLNNTTLTLVSKTSAGSVIPSSNPADGTAVTIGSRLFQVFYNGGDGNNVVIQAVTPVIGVSVTPSSASEVGGQTLVYTFTRDVISGVLPISFTVGGTATLNTDYTVSSNDSGFTFTGTKGTISFADGNATATLVITPLNDTVVEPSETVILTILPGTIYRTALPPNNTATGTITDNNITGVSYNDRNGDGIRNFDDLNNNGSQDAGEPSDEGIAGTVVFLDLNNDGKLSIVEPAATTDYFGRYTLKNVKPGTYVLREIASPAVSGLKTQPLTPDGSYTVIVPEGPLAGLDFGHGLAQASDYGDAPASFGTTLAGNGARHGRLVGFGLGAQIDGEPDGQPTADALGDDTSGIDDEDGVAIAALQRGANQVQVTISTGGRSPGKLQGWIDFNQNGIFDATERVVSNQVLGAGTYNIPINVPASTALGATFARFRYGYENDLGPTGPSLAGEVEDYQVFVLSQNPTASDDVFPTDSDLATQGPIKPLSVNYQLDVLANDIGGANTFGQPLTIIGASLTSPSPGGGTLTVSFDAALGRQVILYTPGPGVEGGSVQSFSYQVQDSLGNISNVANVKLNIALANSFAIDDTFTVTAAALANPTVALQLPAMLNDLTPYPLDDLTHRPQILAVGTLESGDESGNPSDPPLNQASATFTQTGGLTATLSINATDPQKLDFTADPGFRGTAIFKYQIGEVPDDPDTSTSTRFVTIQVTEGGVLATDSQLTAAGYSAELDVSIVGADANGDPTNSPTVVHVGDTFYLRVTSHDLRPVPAGGVSTDRGVQAAYLDLLLNPPPVIVDGVPVPFRQFAAPLPDPDTANPMTSIVFVNGYDIGQNGQNGVTNAPSAGEINEAGAFRSSNNGLGTGSPTVFYVRMQAKQATPTGQSLEVKGDPADAPAFRVVVTATDPNVDPTPVDLTDDQVFLRPTNLAIFNLGEGEFVNMSNTRDVDQDGAVTASDVLTVINTLNAGGARSLVGTTPTGTVATRKMVDVNMDSQLTATDALMVINYINSYSLTARSGVSVSTMAEGESSSTAPDVELGIIAPSTTSSTTTTTTPILITNSSNTSNSSTTSSGSTSTSNSPSTTSSTTSSTTVDPAAADDVFAGLTKAREDLKKRFHK